jgi:hypothetical protein
VFRFEFTIQIKKGMRNSMNNSFLSKKLRQLEDASPYSFHLPVLSFVEIPGQEMHLTSILGKIGGHLDTRNESLASTQFPSSTQGIVIR